MNNVEALGKLNRHGSLSRNSFTLISSSETLSTMSTYGTPILACFFYELLCILDDKDAKGSSITTFWHVLDNRFSLKPDLDNVKSFGDVSEVLGFSIEAVLSGE